MAARGNSAARSGSSTRSALRDLPVIGLAKEREEIFRPGISEPLVIDHSSGAIRLLQRIRDEAHRFANGYHQILMKQRVSESLLDDCPGVSENRKKLLLRHFGSIDKLRVCHGRRNLRRSKASVRSSPRRSLSSSPN